MQLSVFGAKNIITRAARSEKPDRKSALIASQFVFIDLFKKFLRV